MRFFTIVMMIAALVCPCARAQTADEKKIVKRANEIMQNIYMDIWRIRDGYRELAKFGPENMSDTPELPYQYQSIKCLRFKRADSEQSAHGRSGLPSNMDALYIGFSAVKQAVGTFDDPTYVVYVKELRLYLLVYSRSDNRFFEHAIIKIVRKNARPPEEF
jgi:hypothetical protein